MLHATEVLCSISNNDYLKPVLSDTSYTVCSGLDNRCLKSKTILLLRVTFFDESSNRYDTFDIKAHILKATPVCDKQRYYLDLAKSRGRIGSIASQQCLY